MSATTSLASSSEPNDVRQNYGPSISNSQQAPQQATNNPAPPTPPQLPPRLSQAPTFIQRAPKLNLPCADLLAKREDYINTCVPLYDASISGDWEAASIILTERKELVRYSITENGETALHIAASAQNIAFVEALVGLMEKEDLELQNKSGNTALCLAAAAGNTKMAKIMVDKNKSLLTIPGSNEMMPLYMAALFGNRGTVEYLYDNSNKMADDGWNQQNRGWVVLKCIEADLFDITLKMLKDRPELAQAEGVLGVLARKPYAFNDREPHLIWRFINSILGVHVKEKETEAMQLLKIIWKNIMLMPKVEIDKLLRGPIDPPIKDEKGNVITKDGKRTYSSRVLFVAAEMGNTKFVVELIRQYPDLIWKVNDNNQSIFHIAVSCRNESIYNLLYEIGSMKDMITVLRDPKGNNMLHLIGKRAEKTRLEDVSGVTFQMQRELIWFEEVEAMIPPSYRERKNAAGQTPRELFVGI